MRRKDGTYTVEYGIPMVVKSGSSGLKSDGGDGREIEISYRGEPEV